MLSLTRTPPSIAATLLLLSGLVFAATAAHAQGLYRIVGPDGSVTFTDRPPRADAGRAEPLARGGGPAPVLLPPGLREPAARFPVVLYTVPDCPPCDRGRELLRTRGIPHEERVADPQTDAEAWLRRLGSTDAPGLTIGAQVLRGFNADEWQATLDLAGYPRASRLPANHVQPPARPLVARPAQPEAAAMPPAPLPTPLPATSPGGFRF